jgi:DNA polymerase-3 subunit alpha
VHPLQPLQRWRKQATPIGRGRGYRYGLPNQEYYYKSDEEMKNSLDLPEAIINIQEIIDKVEIYSLYRDVLLPKYDIPEEFINPEDER